MTTLPDGREFEAQTFQSVDWRQAVLEEREFHGCTFVGSQLAQAALIRCKLVDCTFRACDLSNLRIKGSTFRGVAFEDSKLLGINWTEVTALAHLRCVRCVLSLSNFSGRDLRHSSFEDCVAREAEFGHANLEGANCRGTDFAGSRFLHTNLTKADFRRALSYAIRPGDNILKKARFSLPEATSLLYGLDIILGD